jgi:predicted ferric reductase
MSVWFTARGAGLSALLLLSVATCLGALVSRPGHAARRYVVQYLHRAAAGLGLGVLVLHVTTILLDSYAHVGITGAIVPFTSSFEPTWVGLGSLAFYTFVGVSLLGLARGRMATSPRGARLWRRLHGLSYAGWAMAVLHGFLSGTDSSVGWVRAIYVTCVSAVVGSMVYRIASIPRGTSAPGAPTDRFAGRPVPADITGVRPPLPTPTRIPDGVSR